MPKQAKTLPSCERLHELLDQRIERPELSKSLDAKIRKSFEQVRTIFVLDMSGFSKTVQRYGIIHYLGMIQRMRRIVKPVVTKHDGIVIKFEADNCFAVFPNPEKALSASLQIHHDLEIANIMTDEVSDVHVSIGIGHGPVLLFCEDMYGNELNLASKLGEDVAERGEILMTSAARKLIKNKKFRFEKVPITISGVTMQAFRLST